MLAQNSHLCKSNAFIFFWFNGISYLSCHCIPFPKVRSECKTHSVFYFCQFLSSSGALSFHSTIRLWSVNNTIITLKVIESQKKFHYFDTRVSDNFKKCIYFFDKILFWKWIYLKLNSCPLMHSYRQLIWVLPFLYF